MSVSQRIKALLGADDSSADGDLGLLEELLAEREARLNLSATYGRPYPNMTDEPTVVFPYTLYTEDGNEYGAGSKEFVLPDNGLADTDSALVQFVASRRDIEGADVTFEELTAVEGTTADATLTDAGDVEVEV